tara:strand:+ start:2698 stop:2946 length:249 start_codon:yes stop_codon:yes gene_type:complete
MMRDPYDYSNTIIKAAARARGTALTPLHRIIEGQKTVSTRKLAAVVDDLHDVLQQDAIHFKKLAEKIERLEKALLKASIRNQ